MHHSQMIQMYTATHYFSIINFKKTWLLSEWTQNWRMPLNDSKCTVLHIGRNNPKHTYYLEQKPVTAVVKQKVLVINITSDLKWELHITILTKNANSLIYLIQKSFRQLYRKMVLELYKSYIRPKLEYAYWVWNPYYVKDIEMIERVQRRVTRLPLELRDMPYETRLSILSLTTLRDIRTRDLIKTYKIIKLDYK